MIKTFKGRQVDYTRPVKIYRNLNSKEVSYSIQQDGLVVGHTNELVLENVKYKVSQKGRDRVLREKRKNVHAFMIGSVVQAKEVKMKYPWRVTYNPYKAPYFVLEVEMLGQGGAHPLSESGLAVITKEGVFAPGMAKVVRD